MTDRLGEAIKEERWKIAFAKFYFQVFQGYTLAVQTLSFFSLEMEMEDQGWRESNIEGFQHRSVYLINATRETNIAPFLFLTFYIFHNQ